MEPETFSIKARSRFARYVLSLSLLLLSPFLPADSNEFNRDFQEAENAFNSQSQAECIPLFESLAERISAARKTRAILKEERLLLEKSLDYLAQAHFNQNDVAKAKAAFLKLIEINPEYRLNEDMVSVKVIDLYNAARKESLSRLSVNTTPQGADVFVDGQRIGTSNVQLYAWKGRHSIEVKKSGYIAQKKEVSILPPVPVDIQFELKQDPAGLSLYKDAKTFLDSGDFKKAQVALEKAITTQPGNALLHEALARSEFFLGFEEKAHSDASTAIELSQRSETKVQRKSEATGFLTSYQWDQAAEIYDQLWRTDVADTDSAFALLFCLLQTERIREAEQALVAFRQRGVPPERLYIAAAEIAAASYNIAEQQSAAQKALESARLSQASGWLSQALILEGGALRNQRDFRQAETVLKEAMQIAKDNGLEAAVMEAGIQLALIYEQEKNIQDAERHYSGVLRLSEKTGSKRYRARALLGLRRMDEAIPLLRIVNDRKNLGEALLHSADLLQKKDLHQARAEYEEALSTLKNRGTPRKIADVYFALGGIVRAQGDLPTAVRYYEDAIEIYRREGDKAASALGLSNLAETLKKYRRTDEAIEKYEQALTLFQELREKTLAARTRRALGDLFSQKKDWERAKGHYKKARADYQALKDQAGTAEVVLQMGTLALQEQRLFDAKNLFEEARSLFQEIGDQKNQELADRKIRAIRGEWKNSGVELQLEAFRLLNEMQYEEAEQKYQEALAAAREAGDKSGQVGCLLSLGFLVFQKKDIPTARRMWEEALTLSREIGEKENEALALYDLSTIYFTLRDYARAEDLYKQSERLYLSIGAQPRKRPWETKK